MKSILGKTSFGQLRVSAPIEKMRISRLDPHSRNEERLTTPVLSKFIVKQDWVNTRKILLGKNATILEDAALHMACRFHPPLEVVQAMAAAAPSSVSLTDNMGRLPLHIAAKCGAAPLVIAYLTEIYPQAAGFQDAIGKTPLHLFCEYYGHQYNEGAANGQSLKESMILVVKSLCRAAPSSVNLEDTEDMTALEYAIDAEVDRRVIRVVQKACEKDWKSRSTAGTTHEAMERNLLEQSHQQTAQLRKDILHETDAKNLTNSSPKNSEAVHLDSGRPRPRPKMPMKMLSQNSGRAFAA